MSLLREWLKEQGMSSLTEQESSRIKKVKIRKKLKTLTRGRNGTQELQCPPNSSLFRSLLAHTHKRNIIVTQAGQIQ